MVRITTSAVAVSLLALPALAVSSKQYERTVAESDLYGRDFADLDDVILTREDLDDIFGREFVTDIDERSPGFGGLFKIGAKLIGKIGSKGVKHAESAQHSKAGHRANSLIKGVNNVNDAYSQFSNNNYPREFDDEEFDIFGREFVTDLDERSPGFGGLFKIGAKLIGKIGSKGVKHAESAQHSKAGHRANSLIKGVNNVNDAYSQFSNNNYPREFNDEEFDLRDFDEDLETREPLNFGLLAKGFHRAEKVQEAASYIPQPQPQPQPQTNQNYNGPRDIDEELFDRDFDDEEFFVREYFDDLD